MPDQRSVMKEFRSLDEKRRLQGLTPDEESRHGRLRDLIGPEMGAGGLQGGFDVNAAAARLRESLLPAGLRNRPPPTPVALEPEPEPELSSADAVASAYEASPFAPVDLGAAAADPYFDPASLGSEDAQGWSTQQQYDPNAAAAYDPNAQPYDPNAAGTYDPNAAAAWDPNAQPYDPNAAAAWDPNAQPYDPNVAAAYDPNAQPYDPNAAAAYDPNAQPYDPNAAAAYDPNAQPYDPNAAGAWDPNAQPYDPNAAAAWDPNTTPAASPELEPEFDPGAGWDPHAEATDALAASLEATALALEPAALPAPEAPAWDAPAEGAVAEAPADPALEAGWTDDDALGALDDPSAEPAAAPWGGATTDAAASPLTAPATDALFDGAASPFGWSPEPEAAAAAEGATFGEYDEAGAPAAVPEGGDAGLEALLPFDPAADAVLDPGALPEGFAGEAFAAEPGEYHDTAGFAATPAEPPVDLPQDGAGFRAAQTVSADASAEWHPDAALDAGFQLASGGSFEHHTPWQGGDLAAPEPEADLSGPAPALDFSAPDFSTGDDAGDPADVFTAPPAALEPAAPAEPEPVIEEILTLDGEDILEEIPLDELDAAPPPSLEFEPLEVAPPVAAAPSAPAPAPAPAFAAAAAAPPPKVAPLAPAVSPAPPPASAPVLAPPAPAVSPAPPPSAPVLASPAPAAPPSQARPAPPAPPAPVPAPAAALAPLRDAASTITGSHRVVVHTVEGLVKRGVLEDADLAAAALDFAAAPGTDPEVLPTDKVKAIFFMLPPGETPPAAEGKRVRVTFRDGRQVAGFSPDYREGTTGFFMIPADTRTNTGRIWVYQAAVRQVTVS